MFIEKNFFRQVMGKFATGVTVVTTCSREGFAGITVNSFCSISLDPPLVLVCIDLKSNTLGYFRESRSFVINILSEKQEHLSRCFATPSEERYEHFCHVSNHGAVTGSPIIEGVLAFVEARIIAEYPGGDHAIFIGRVVALGSGGQVVFADDAGEQCTQLTEYNDDPATCSAADPLTYYCGLYRQLASDYQRPSLSVHQDEKNYLRVG